jgi:MoaA/NifB/PqqE/SkfB family radical SAM enzyme
MSNEHKIFILKNKRKKIDSVSTSFCTAKWLQTTLYLQNGYNHSCHHPSPHKIPLEEIEKDPAALHNSQFKKQQRALMLTGERPSECDYCWKIEDLGKDYFSDRHYKTSDYWAWDRFREIASADPYENVYPSYLEVSFSNACNLKCSYCSPEISSKWLEEIKQYGPYPIPESNQDIEWYKKVGRYPYKHSDDNPYVEAFWKWFPEALPHLRVFRITGGEPLMSKDTWKVLEYIRENPQPELEIAINTNLVVEERLIDRLLLAINDIKDKVKKVDIYTSLESIGKQAEYSRFGLDYEYWMANVRKCLEQTECTVSVMTTINILSLPTFSKFLELIMQLRCDYNRSLEFNRIPISINYLRWPLHLSVKLLTQSLREKYANKIMQIGQQWLKYHNKHQYARLYLEEWDQIKRFCDYLSQDEEVGNRRKHFVDYINEYDKRRGTDFSKTFPEFAYLLKEWNA